MAKCLRLRIVIRLQSFTHTSVSDFMPPKACVRKVTSDLACSTNLQLPLQNSIEINNLFLLSVSLLIVIFPMLPHGTGQYIGGHISFFLTCYFDVWCLNS